MKMVKSAIAHERDQTKAKNDSISLQSIQNNMLTSVIIITIIITTIVINKKKKTQRGRSTNPWRDWWKGQSKFFRLEFFFFFFFFILNLLTATEFYNPIWYKNKKLTSLPHKQMVISSLFFLEKKRTKTKTKRKQKW